MNWQGIAALLLVTVAAVWLLRHFARELRAFLRKEGGCAKCGFAANLRTNVSSAEARRAAGVMPLTPSRPSTRPHKP